MRKTDPAKEIAAFCDALATGGSTKGDVHIANAFSVRPWSAEFLLILNAFMDRTELVISTIDRVDVDDDHRKEMKSHVRALQGLCSLKVLGATWNNSDGGLPLVKGASRAAVSSLSPSIRLWVWYPLLEEQERQGVLAQVEMIIGKLEELQLGDRDFIRQALIDGLRQFHFRLARLKWLGWGYTIAGLRSVITAYLALERDFPNANENTSAAAAMKWTQGLFETVWKYTGYAADAKSRYDVAALAFNVAHVAGPFIAGYLSAG
ncbi:hypothetical protein [Mesorhizobium koreense]|uniref:hypothetical protein n=1 Tax=Mesorhizobium koreense TaxID=3074855 RepID=UPI00287B9F72|nr:hypothetical protein [Mesorhizobium sp. WR6]